MEDMLSRIIGEDIRIQTVLSSDLWVVKMDPTQGEQIILNLAANARDAMPTGGTLTIETANVVIDEKNSAEWYRIRTGEYVLLAVSDTGIGISDQVKAHLFEPFFTTKEVGKGTGLGLAAVHGIVKQNGGHIFVHSQEGRGASFRILLPHAEAAAPSPPLTATASDVALGSETILLVEDDEDVRELAHRVLETHGYTVIEAQDGPEALQVAASYSGPIHLLLTDVVMPGLSGKQLASQLTLTRTGLSVVFMSGYTEEAIAHNGVLVPGTELLEKPFRPSALVRKVREVLDMGTGEYYE
jgi:CheY-like chemotaxis protein